MSRSLACLIFCMSALVACQTLHPNVSPLLSPVATLAAMLPPATVNLTPVKQAAAFGETWKYWPAAEKPLAIYAAALNDDVLWLGTSFGVWRVDPLTGAHIQYDDLGKITLILPIEHGPLWATGDNGIFYFDGQQWSQLVLSDNLQYFQGKFAILGLDMKGDLWLAAEARYPVILHFAGHIPPTNGTWAVEMNQMPPSWYGGNCKVWSAFAARSYSHHSTLDCQTLARLRPTEAPYEGAFLNSALDHDGSVWWVGGQTLHHLSGGQSIDLELPTNLVNAVAPDPVHGVWLGTDQGLLYSDGQSMRAISLGLDTYTLHDRPRNLAVDADGNVWVVTANGLQKMSADSRVWQTIADFGLSDRGNRLPLGTIAAAREGGIWATHGWDLWRFGGSSIMPPVDAPLDRRCPLIRLSVDQRGNVWSPAPGCGAVQYIPGTNQWIRHEPEPSIDEILVDANNTIYARGVSGMYTIRAISSSSIISMTDWHMVTPQDPVRELDVAVAINAQGGIWVQSLDTQEVQFYREGEIASFNPPLQARALYRVYVDKAWQIWAGGTNELVVFNGQDWRHIATPRVSPIRDITSDPQGRILIAGDQGIAVYDPAADKQK